MNTKLLIFGIVLLMSCKKQQPTPQTESIVSTTIIEAKTPKLFNVTGNWEFLQTNLNRTIVKPPFNCYKGDTVNVKGNAQATYPNPSYNMSVFIYIDGALIEENFNINNYNKSFIIK